MNITVNFDIDYFVAAANAIPVTGKFYAAHDQLKAESVEETKKVEDYHSNVAQTRAKGPHSKYDAPATENQA
ncbi:hypothetical protein HF086_012006 [Spodoptera exigua]|uniref:Uncharacterized protein n=1 Tax=Spodoptera exigua TaxID=7107 RepID=A0A922MJ12_SPOEX|nr:hypothetical protein HF086_012006 [Spodoptera exigua]